MKPLFAMGAERKRDFPQLPSVDLGRVDGMTVVEVDGGPRLELPEEPVDVKASLRDALLEGHDWREEFCRRHVPRYLALEPVAACPRAVRHDREDFFDHVIAFRRELWLWLIGDRQWLQYVTGLAGRVVRRLPAATQA